MQASFETILGLTVREQVIFLGGGHSFGGATLDGSGWNGSFTGSDSWPKVGRAGRICLGSRLSDFEVLFSGHAACREDRCEWLAGVQLTKAVWCVRPTCERVNCL